MFGIEIKDNSLRIDGIVSVSEASDKIISVKTTEKHLTVSGSGLSVSKLDVDAGTLAATGKVSSVKISGASGGLLKKLAK